MNLDSSVQLLVNRIALQLHILPKFPRDNRIRKETDVWLSLKK